MSKKNLTEQAKREVLNDLHAYIDSGDFVAVEMLLRNEKQYLNETDILNLIDMAIQNIDIPLLIALVSNYWGPKKDIDYIRDKFERSARRGQSATEAKVNKIITDILNGRL